MKNLFKRSRKESMAEPISVKARSDRRRDPRIEEKKEVILEVMDAKDKERKDAETTAKSLDISVSGIRVQSPLSFSPETLVRLRIPSDRLGKWIQVTGMIKWIKRTEEESVVELGLEFIDAHPETVIDLMEHIYRRPV